MIAVLSKEIEYAPGVVTSVLDTVSWVPVFEGAFLPRVCLEDAERQRTTYQVSTELGGRRRDLVLNLSGHKAGAYFWPREGSNVMVASARVKVLGLKIPVIRFNSLA